MNKNQQPSIDFTDEKESRLSGAPCVCVLISFHFMRQALRTNKSLGGNGFDDSVHPFLPFIVFTVPMNKLAGWLVDIGGFLFFFLILNLNLVFFFFFFSFCWHTQAHTHTDVCT
ncbi:hypothetical protein BD289DRAFT_173606 [Coniella lustricola]|uniref:Uncharacterized protein n=1 Tax=Coniella lustricola TaxID=2025994 RepID=A0A2T2ZTN8_9PEZI|nr:hypothetical protein BD289DRAFT_173606 [Coniella lustricola]